MQYFYNVDDRGVATLTLNRPEVHNAFDDELIKGITSLFEGIRKDRTLRLVVLTGAGKSFSAGADVRWMKKMIHYSEEENIQDARALHRMLEVMNHCPVPLLGKVNGAALGGGVGLVGVCDMVLASSEAIFGLTEIRLGLVPAVISPFVVAKIGESHARGLFLSGERFCAQRALDVGLVHSICAPENLDTETEKKVEEFLMGGPRAQREAKSLLFKVLAGANPVEDQTCKTIARVRISQEGQEGMAAMLGKRKPQWGKR